MKQTPRPLKTLGRDASNLRHSSFPVQVRWPIVRVEPGAARTGSLNLEIAIMKKFAALGLVAALAFAPVVSFAQTATPDASATPAMSDTVKKPSSAKSMHKMHKPMMHKKMMHKKMMKPMATPMATDTPKS
jgi:hypothetical protein